MVEVLKNSYIQKAIFLSPRPYFCNFRKKLREFIEIQKHKNMLFSKEIREQHIFYIFKENYESYNVQFINLRKYDVVIIKIIIVKRACMKKVAGIMNKENIHRKN